MVSKRFAILVILRIILLVLTITALAFIFAKTELFFNQIILLGIIILQVAELIRFVTYTNRELARLLLAIRYADFSISFKGKKHGKSFVELQNALVEIVEAFKKVSVEKEAQFKFLQVIVNTMRIGVVAVKEEHTIELMNQEAEEILGIKKPNYLKQLKQLSPRFVEETEETGDNERKLIEWQKQEKKLQLSIQVNRLKILNYRYSIITFQNIKSEIEQKEIEAWHKLIRILTHEIMNSITPVTSMTETMIMLLEDEGQPKHAEALDDETLEDLRFSLKTIQKRSEGLLHFVEDYRKLTRIKHLALETIEVEDLLGSMEILMKAELEKTGIQLTIQSQPWLKIKMDRKLIEQILLNLITNARHALANQSAPQLTLKAFSNANTKFIAVTDNGTGIDPAKMDQIFIPFYSTKAEGSGIGLSLSKQIMKKHKGDLTVKSTLGEGATFQLEFLG
ncbi:sensor histidine kinase [Roseivirga pacifica]|uniref:sensor histidine kinase n=1 Tax=Roseivirga pacifica TaxID=1267423 RepID=UPI002095E0D4|nr:ATP-binding protein [Roseivirga pacifica]MCO6357137.1 GHKL domain-containing protein [Roseivirga pacifica]MCO6368150.1 GHKL domain-containing protein [Roseivirga pacifica]MCO6369369.1 GHKL domain-containing protein [Roseivirga pacifica]MCO6373223.1 GHKL domain-containing protein [Roseivirga pacifica]MCO6377520.1 GHKL domain-containing protein [Roseivirga pacifica]